MALSQGRLLLYTVPTAVGSFPSHKYSCFKPKQEFVATSTEARYDFKYRSESYEKGEYALDHLLSRVRPRDNNILALGDRYSIPSQRLLDLFLRTNCLVSSLSKSL